MECWLLIDMRVLLTGGDSFIGSHFVTELLERGDDVTVLVLNGAKMPVEMSKNLKIVEGDISVKETLAGIKGPFDIIFHLAAHVHKVVKTVEEIREVFKVNVQGTKNLLDTAGHHAEHIILFSSVSVYGVEKGNMLNETTDVQPVTYYGKSKLEAELLLEEWANLFGKGCTSLRLPLVYGPGNKGNIYRLIKAVETDRFLLPGKGFCKRSMVYVGNVVDAAIAIAAVSQPLYNIYIVTDGIDYSVKELYETIAKGLGKKPSPFHVPESFVRLLAIGGDLAEQLTGRAFRVNSEILSKLTNTLTFSCMKLQKDFGFVPKYNLYNTIDKTIRWYRGCGNNQSEK